MRVKRNGVSLCFVQSSFSNIIPDLDLLIYKSETHPLVVDIQRDVGGGEGGRRVAVGDEGPPVLQPCPVHGHNGHSDGNNWNISLVKSPQ